MWRRFSGDNTCLYLLRTNKDQWIGLVDLNFLPTCVLHGGTSTCLRVTYVQFELMDTLRRSTSKHNLSQWFGVMPINVVSSSVYYMKCVILR